MAYHLHQASARPVHYAGRPESASPATGFASMHKEQLEHLIQTALGVVGSSTD
jgi:2-oxoglutarate dehydrogenase complex dehydrogenase (E1) component-like enzyme